MRLYIRIIVSEENQGQWVTKGCSPNLHSFSPNIHLLLAFKLAYWHNNGWQTCAEENVLKGPCFSLDDNTACCRHHPVPRVGGNNQGNTQLEARDDWEEEQRKDRGVCGEYRIYCFLSFFFLSVIYPLWLPLYTDLMYRCLHSFV